VSEGIIGEFSGITGTALMLLLGMSGEMSGGMPPSKCHIAGYFPKVQIFSNFPNGLTTWENLFWTADCFRRLDCGIEILEF